MNPLDALLGIDPAETSDSTSLVSTETQTTAIEVVEADTPTTEKELETDFQEARTNIKKMITNVMGALDSAVMVAQAGDSPKGFEAVAAVLEKLVEANQVLVELHLKKKETLDKPVSPGGATNVTVEKAVFIGKASDLLRQIREEERRLNRELDTENP